MEGVTPEKEHVINQGNMKTNAMFADEEVVNYAHTYNGPFCLKWASYMNAP